MPPKGKKKGKEETALVDPEPEITELEKYAFVFENIRAGTFLEAPIDERTATRARDVFGQNAFQAAAHAQANEAMEWMLQRKYFEPDSAVPTTGRVQPNRARSICPPTQVA